MLFSFGGPPIVTDDAFTAGDGQFDINLIYTKFGGIDATEFPVIDVNYGMSETTEIKLEYVHVETSGHTLEVENFIETGIKWRFYESETLFISTFPQYAYVGVEHDSKHEDINVITLPIEITKKIGSQFGFTLEVGYQAWIDAKDSHLEHVLEWGTVFSYFPQDGTDILFDVNDKNDFKHVHRTSYLLGVKQALYKDNISLLLSGGYATYESHENGAQIYTGLNFRF
jgi:hypothetical protein